MPKDPRNFRRKDLIIMLGLCSVMLVLVGGLVSHLYLPRVQNFATSALGDLKHSAGQKPSSVPASLVPDESRGPASHTPNQER